MRRMEQEDGGGEGKGGGIHGGAKSKAAKRTRSEGRGDLERDRRMRGSNYVVRFAPRDVHLAVAARDERSSARYRDVPG